MTRWHPLSTYDEQRKVQEEVTTQARGGRKTTRRLSVIVCTYNRRNLVLALLSSLRRQSLPCEQFEVIVIDNGSTDGTFQAIQSYISLEEQQRPAEEEGWSMHCLVEPQNGLAHARNLGLRVALGEIVVFLDDDTIVDTRFLERLLLAYEETGADAVGGPVEIRWEAARPYWLSNDLLAMLGHFVPFRTRTQLPAALTFSTSSFSVKTTALRLIGGFTPFLSKRLNAPISMEVADVCRRLRKAGYTLWYEPSAITVHRVRRARLERAFLVGRAYWQGRSEILAQYAATDQENEPAKHTLFATFRAVLPEINEIAQIALLHRPLLSLARKSANERLLAAIAQAHAWGRVRQQFSLLDHAPAMMRVPAVQFVRAGEHDAAFLIQELRRQGVHCTTTTARLSLAWLWRHRARQKQAIGVLHFYCPGAFELNHWQRQRLLCKLWLAQRLGIPIVTTDAGGWWQSVRGLRAFARRAFEQKMLTCSTIVLAYTRHPEQLYPDPQMRRRVRPLTHPGLYGVIQEPLPRAQAHTRLGLPSHPAFVYLCLAYMHSEREVMHLIATFCDMQSRLLQQGVSVQVEPLLLLVGTPVDRKQPLAVLKRAALHPSIHTFITWREEDLPLYMGAANALVLPHLLSISAGMLDTAVLFYSYGCIVIAPDLPRFHGMLPSHACLLYDPASRASFVQVLSAAQGHMYQFKEQEVALETHKGWQRCARHLTELYTLLMNSDLPHHSHYAHSVPLRPQETHMKR